MVQAGYLPGTERSPGARVGARAGRQAGDNYLATAAAGNAVVIGVQEEPTLYAGDPLACIELGDATAIAGAAVNAGQLVKCTATGQFIPVTSVGDNIAGRAKSSGLERPATSSFFWSFLRSTANSTFTWRESSRRRTRNSSSASSEESE